MKSLNSTKKQNLICLGKYIKDARIENKLSLRSLADLSKTNYRTIHKIERAEMVNINPNNLARLSSILKLDIVRVLTLAGYFELVFRLKYGDK